MEVWLLSRGLVCDVSVRGLVCDVSVRGLVVYGGWFVSVCVSTVLCLFVCLWVDFVSVCGLILNVIWFRVLTSK